MNILIATYTTTNPYIGGIENVSWNLAKEFRKMGHKVCFISVDRATYPELLNQEPGNFTQYYFSHEDDKESIISILKNEQIDIILSQHFITSKRITGLYKDIKDLDIKLVCAQHCHPLHFIKDVEDIIMYKEPQGYLFMRQRLGCNIIKWIRAIALILLYRFGRLESVKLAEREVMRSIYDNSDGYVLLSDRYIEPFRLFLEKDKCEKLHSITNPIFSQNDKIDIRDKEKVLLYVGRLAKSAKRVDRLLMIWKRIYKDFPDWKLVIVGDGSDKSYLEELAHKNKIRQVEFKGKQNPSEYYKRASIFAMTSTIEGFGLVLMEAQQAGCIPMAFESFEAVKDIITDGEDGFLIPPFELNTYADKLSRLMRDEELRITIANRCASKDYSNFKVENIALQWIELFKNIQLRK